MNIRFVKSSEKKQIVEELNKQFGITELPYLMFEAGKEKMRAFSGNMTKEELIKLSELANIEIIGTYIIKKEHDFRLSMDACNILKPQITKNILEINKEQFDKWIRGNDLEIKVPQGTYVISHEGDFIGCGKSNGEKIFNYVPKDRRLKSKQN